MNPGTEVLMNRVLIISPDKQWNEAVVQSLVDGGFKYECAVTGKEAQLAAYKSPFDYIFLNLSVTSHSGLEVFKYLKVSGTRSIVFLIIPSVSWLAEHDLTEKHLRKLGAEHILVTPGALAIVKAIRDLGKIKTHVEAVVDNEPLCESAEATISDDIFTRIRVDEFFQDVVAVTDFYIRLGANKYVKIFRKGEITSSAQVKKYAQNGQKFIYFPTSDRPAFISYQNDLAKRAIATSDNPGGIVIRAMKSANEKLVEELKGSGIQPALLEEGKQICQNMYDSAMKDKGLRDIISEFEKFDPKTFSDSFLVSFFSTVICKNIEWVGTKTIESLALGALLHDIGTLQLEESIRGLDYGQMNDEQRGKFHHHPVLGAQALSKVPRLNMAVLTIVQQHHEYNDGSGFPFGLSSTKIFPLAKIVSLADGLTDYIKENEVSILDGLRGFLSVRENLMRYEPDLVRNLIRGFKS